MRRLVEEHPAIAIGFLKAFAGKLRYFTRKVEDLSFRSVTSRVAKFLLEMADSASPLHWAVFLFAITHKIWYVSCLGNASPALTSIRNGGTCILSI